MKTPTAKFMVDETGVNFFVWSIITDGFFKLPYTKKFLGAPLKLEVMWIENERGQWASDFKNIKQLADNTLCKLKAKTFELKEIGRLHRLYGEKTLALCKKLNSYSGLPPATTLVNLLKQAFENFKHLNSLGFTIVWSDMEYGILTKALEKILNSKGVKPEKIPTTLSFLITATKPVRPWEEKKDLLKIAIKYKFYPAAVSSPEFHRHCRKYIWVQYGYQGPELTEEFFQVELKKLFKSSLKQQYQNHLNYFKDLAVKQHSLENKLGFTIDEKYLFAAAREIMYLKAYRVDVRHYFHWTVDKLFKQLSAKYSIPFIWFHYANRKDIFNLISKGKVDIREGLARSEFLFRVTEKGRVKFLNKPQAQKYLQKNVTAETIVEAQELSGSVAFPGKIKGTVRIVLSRYDIHKVGRGDILVATATNPDLLPAMSKAAAFVTDSGGITSHAAIVSREMKRPCIIGTRFATKILKDGDLVEVDANKGIVRKIK